MGWAIHLIALDVQLHKFGVCTIVRVRFNYLSAGWNLIIWHILNDELLVRTLSKIFTLAVVICFVACYTFKTMSVRPATKFWDWIIKKFSRGDCKSVLQLTTRVVWRLYSSRSAISVPYLYMPAKLWHCLGLYFQYEL